MKNDSFKVKNKSQEKYNDYYIPVYKLKTEHDSND